MPAIDAGCSYRGEDVVQTMERICTQTRYPKMIRVDQGSEFISRDLDLWAYANGVALEFSRPGKPTDSAFIEAFNGRPRAERLSANWFMSLPDAREKLECGCRDDNTVRSNSAVGNKSPVTLPIELDAEAVRQVLQALAITSLKVRSKMVGLITALVGERER